MPTSLSSHKVLNEKYFIEKKAKTSTSGFKPSKVNYVKKKTDPNLKPKQEDNPKFYLQCGHLV